MFDELDAQADKPRERHIAEAMTRKRDAFMFFPGELRHLIRAVILFLDACHPNDVPLRIAFPRYPGGLTDFRTGGVLASKFLAELLETASLLLVVAWRRADRLWNQAEVRRLAGHRSPVGHGLPGRN